jgi:hypothetical protein
MIAIEYNTATSANMRTNGQGLLDHSSACTAFLTGIVRWNGNHIDLMHMAIVLQPANEGSPTCIMDRFSQFAVTYHVSDLKVFIGNQVVRRDVRVCYFTSKILTLPLHFQMLLGQSFAGFLAVRRFLLFAGVASLETCKLLLRFAVESGVVDCLTFAIGQVRFEPYINPELLASRDMLNRSLGINTELAVVAVCASDNANTLDLFDWELFHSLVFVPNQLDAANTTAVCEGDVAAIKLPARGFVLDASIVMLELGIALLAWLLAIASIIEAGDSKPSAISRSLTGHGIEKTSKGVFIGQDSTVGLQVVFRDGRRIHPQPQRLVTDELDRPDSLIDGSILLFASTQLVLIDQHVCLTAFLLLFLDMLFNGSQDLPIQGSIVLFSYLSYLFQQMSREPDIERLDIIFHMASIALYWLLVKRGKRDYVARLRGPVPLSQRGRAIHPHI